MYVVLKGLDIFLLENKKNTLIKTMILAVFECVGVRLYVPSRKKKHTADSEVSQQHEEPNSFDFFF